MGGTLQAHGSFLLPDVSPHSLGGGWSGVSAAAQLCARGDSGVGAGGLGHGPEPLASAERHGVQKGPLSPSPACICSTRCCLGRFTARCPRPQPGGRCRPLRQVPAFMPGPPAQPVCPPAPGHCPQCAHTSPVSLAALPCRQPPESLPAPLPATRQLLSFGSPSCPPRGASLLTFHRPPSTGPKPWEGWSLGQHLRDACESHSRRGTRTLLEAQTGLGHRVIHRAWPSLFPQMSTHCPPGVPVPANSDSGGGIS